MENIENNNNEEVVNEQVEGNESEAIEQVAEGALPETPSQEDIAEDDTEDIVDPDEEEGDGQLSLLGDDPQPVKKKTPLENAKPTPATKAKAKPTVTTKVNTEYTVYYAGSRIDVPEDDMTVEELRSFLEADFPELSKERANLIVDEAKKHVIPVVSGAKKG